MVSARYWPAGKIGSHLNNFGEWMAVVPTGQLRLTVSQDDEDGLENVIRQQAD